MVHRTRELRVRQLIMVVNAIRLHMAEFGLVAWIGLPEVKELMAIIADETDTRLPSVARTCPFVPIGRDNPIRDRNNRRNAQQAFRNR